MSDILDLTALGQVLIISLVGAVGVVAVFSLGLRGTTSYAASRQAGSGGVLSIAGAIICFTICLGAVGFGIWTMLTTK